MGCSALPVAGALLLGVGMLTRLRQPLGQMCQFSLGAGVTTAGSTSGGGTEAGRGWGGQQVHESSAAGLSGPSVLGLF